LRHGGWLSIARISAAIRAVAPLPELPQDRPNLSNRGQVISSRMNNVSIGPAYLPRKLQKESAKARIDDRYVIKQRTSWRTS
jgi:hypothetical protein